MKPLVALCIASGSCRLASILRMANNRADGGELQQNSRKRPKRSWGGRLSA